MAKIYRVSLRHERKKLKQLTQADNHNYRRNDYQRSNIDPARTHLNRTYYRMYDDPSLSLKQMIERRIEEIPPNERPKIVDKGNNETVFAVELVLQASPEFFENHPDKLDDWINSNVEFIKKRYGENLLDIVLHLDEKTPHFHIHVLPLERTQKKKRLGAKQKAAGMEQQYYTSYSLNAKKLFSPTEQSRNQDAFVKPVKHLDIHRGIKNSDKRHVSIHDYHKRVKEACVLANNKVNRKVEYKIPKPAIKKTLLGNAFEDMPTYYNRVKNDVKTFISEIKEYVRTIEYALHSERDKNALLSNTIEKINKICDDDHALLSTRFDEMKQELSSLRDIESKLSYQEQANAHLAQMVATERTEKLELEKQLYRASQKRSSKDLDR